MTPVLPYSNTQTRWRQDNNNNNKRENYRAMFLNIDAKVLNKILETFLHD